jgi:hypothetical protein
MLGKNLLRGWVEGQNLAIAYRAAEGQVEPLAELVTDLLRLQVEVLVTAGGISVTYAAKAATSTLPIVMVTSGDPVQAGLVESLARPEGNVTGVAGLGVEIIERQLTLLKSGILQEKKGPDPQEPCPTWQHPGSPCAPTLGHGTQHLSAVLTRLLRLAVCVSLWHAVE